MARKLRVEYPGALLSLDESRRPPGSYLRRRSGPPALPGNAEPELPENRLGSLRLLPDEQSFSSRGRDTKRQPGRGMNWIASRLNMGTGVMLRIACRRRQDGEKHANMRD